MEPTEQQPTGQEPVSSTPTAVESPKVAREWAPPIQRNQSDLLVDLDRRVRWMEGDIKELIRTGSRTLSAIRELSDQVRAIESQHRADDDDSVTTDEEEENPS